MKNWIIQIGFLATLCLFASTAMADKIVIYNGHHGGHNNHDRGHYNDRGYRYGSDHDRHRGYKKHARRHYSDNYHYRPHRNRYGYRNKYVPHHYSHAPRYVPQPRYGHGYHSATPVIVGSLIGGVIGAELGHGGPLALGGALLGASIGRDIAYRHDYHH